MRLCGYMIESNEIEFSLHIILDVDVEQTQYL